jgi:nucleotide-binding universal stress UspA family protein
MEGIDMLPVKKILCPTDFSEPSFEGLKAADELASHFSAELFLVHVIASVPVASASSFPGGAGAPTGFDIAAYQKELEEAAKKKLQEVVKNKTSKELKVRPMLTEGAAANEIVRFADEKKVDLIVIATHGETGWRHLIFGSVAEKVVREAKCPVLTVRAPEEES